MRSSGRRGDVPERPLRFTLGSCDRNCRASSAFSDLTIQSISRIVCEQLISKPSEQSANKVYDP